MKKKNLFFFLLLFIASNAYSQNMGKLTPYLNALNEKGKEPIYFILEKLDRYDLILFDDALHTSVEPFEFYRDLIRNADFQKKSSIFSLKLLPLINSQVWMLTLIQKQMIYNFYIRLFKMTLVELVGHTKPILIYCKPFGK